MIHGTREESERNPKFIPGFNQNWDRELVDVRKPGHQHHEYSNLAFEFDQAGQYGITCQRSHYVSIPGNLVYQRRDVPSMSVKPCCCGLPRMCTSEQLANHDIRQHNETQSTPGSWRSGAVEGVRNSE